MNMYLVVFILCVPVCSAVIYHLNDTEYDLMPALFALDEHGTCLRAPGGVYCQCLASLHAEPHNSLMKMITEYSEANNKHYNHTEIHRGVCITRTCRKHVHNKNLNKAEDLESVLEGCLNETIYQEYGLQAKLLNVHSCDRHNEQNDTDFYDFVIMGGFAMLLIVNLIGSSYDIFWRKYNKSKKGKSNEGKQYLLSFSVVQNWEELMKASSEEPRQKALRMLHGVRVLATLGVLIAHVMLLGVIFTDNPHQFEKTYENWIYQVIVNGLMIVQIFFFMSGFLLVYNLEMVQKEQITWVAAVKLIVHRLCRIMPMNAVVLMFSASWLRHVGSGPLWKLTVNGVVQDCRKYWWHHLINVNNYFPEDKFCLFPTWYLAVDFQLFVLGVIVYVATKSRGRCLVLTVLTLVGILTPALQVILQDMDATVIQRPSLYLTLVNDTFHYVHVHAQTNLPCFIIGMASGQFVHHALQTKRPLPTYMNHRYLSLIMFPVILVFISTGSVFYRDGEPVSLGVKLAYAATHRAIMGALVAFSVVAHVLNPDAFRGVYEWQGWTVASRLSYCVYLLHMMVIYLLMGTRTQLAHMAVFPLMVTYFGVCVVTFLVAIPLHLVVEAPFNKLTKNIFNRHADHKTE